MAVMKKNLTMLTLLLSSMLLFTSCTQEPPPNPTPVPTQTITLTPAPTLTTTATAPLQGLTNFKAEVAGIEFGFTPAQMLAKLKDKGIDVIWP